MVDPSHPAWRRLLRDVARRYAGLYDRRFVAVKLRYDPVYLAILGSGVLPSEGRLVDLGCGRGILLALLDAARRMSDPPSGWRPPGERLALEGFEVRPREVAIARAVLGPAATITAADATAVPLPPARVFVLLDVLHYLPRASQDALLARVARALEPGGVLILRDADAAMGLRFFCTRAAERYCALARGHWRQRFCYRTIAGLRRRLEDHGLETTQRPMWAGSPFANRLVEARKPAAERRAEARTPAEARRRDAS